MQQIILIDRYREHLLPIVFTKPIAEIRVGIMTIKEKWEKYTNAKVDILSADYLKNKFPTPETDQDTIWIDARILPNSNLARTVLNIDKKQLLIDTNGDFVALRNKEFLNVLHNNELDSGINHVIYQDEIELIKKTWDIFTHNGNEIKKDFLLLTNGRDSAKIPDYVYATKVENIFLEPGVKLSPCSLDAEDGPIYLGKNSEILDFATIKGPFAILEHSQIKIGAKIYGNSTIGPQCKVGGEINNVVFQSYSNKAHDGFIGNAYIGEWCNIGADSNNSNLKNTYEKVKMWNYAINAYENTGLQFAGLVMGDHTKLAINTMLNTGTVIGCSCNIFGAGFPRTFIPSFRWGGAGGFRVYDFDKAISTASNMMNRRDKKLSETDIEILKYVFEKET